MCKIEKVLRWATPETRTVEYLVARLDIPVCINYLVINPTGLVQAYVHEPYYNFANWDSSEGYGLSVARVKFTGDWRRTKQYVGIPLSDQTR